MVQVMLGHASLDATALYTRVAIRTLKEVHERTHPGAKRGKPDATKSKDGSSDVEAAELPAAPEAEQAEEVERSGAVPPSTKSPARARLRDDAAAAQSPREERSPRPRRAH